MIFFLDIQASPTGGPSGHAIYTRYGSVGQRAKGDVIRYKSPAVQYGDVEGIVTPGGIPLSQEALDRMCRNTCRDAIKQMAPSGDLLLMDYIGRRYYDLTVAGCSFVIRGRYEVCISPQADGTMAVHIRDRDTPQPAQK